MKVFLDSVGCRLNQSEIERIGRQFSEAGHHLVGSAEQSDLVVINTCTVTAAAAADSRSHARQAHQRNPRARIVLTGCWSELEGQAAAELPGVSEVIPNQAKDAFVAELLDLPIEIEPTARHPIPGPRRRTRAFIKAQDGCDNHCTYCLTTIARGAGRSLPLEQVVEEVRAAVEAGAEEAVLTGVQLSAYGAGSRGLSLRLLVATLLAETDISRLRLSSLEPWGVDEGFFDLWENRRLCRQLHLPLQSGSAATLKRMARPITPQRYASLVAAARQRIPGVAITTDIIAGFPGENEREADESMAFIKSMRFADAHVFAYSGRPGTASTRLPQQVPTRVARLRSQRLREIIQDSAREYRTAFLGTLLPVLWERAAPEPDGRWLMSGLSDNYLRVMALAPEPRLNTISSVRPLKLKDEILEGEIVS